MRNSSETRQNRRRLADIVFSSCASVEWALLSPAKINLDCAEFNPTVSRFLLPPALSERICDFGNEVIYRRTTGGQICSRPNKGTRSKIKSLTVIDTNGVIWRNLLPRICPCFLTNSLTTGSTVVTRISRRSSEASFGFGGKTCLPDSARLAAVSKSRCTLPDFGRKMGTCIRCLPRQSSYGRRRNLPEVSRREDVATWQPRPTLGNALVILFARFVYNNPQ